MNNFDIILQKVNEAADSELLEILIKKTTKVVDLIKATHWREEQKDAYVAENSDTAEEWLDSFQDLDDFLASLKSLNQ